MAGLKETTARLAAYQRNLSKLRGGSRTSSPSRNHLTEVVDFGADPGNLRMFQYVPDDLPRNAPLVVVLHGCTQSAASYDIGSGWSTLADRFGFAVVFAEQQTANNPNVCFNWFQPQDTSRGSGEAASIRAMVETAVRANGSDRGQVFVTGLSAGGAMTAVMLATYPETFAGGAIIAGLPYGVAGSVQEALEAMYQGRTRTPAQWGDAVRHASNHRGPWPRVSIWHGSSDTTVLPLNAVEIEKQWTNLHALPLNASESDRLDGYPRRIWRNAGGEALVESITVTGMAHGTPIAAAGERGYGKAGPHILEAGISSSFHIAQFWGLLEEREGVEAKPKPQRPKPGAPAPTPAKAAPRLRASDAAGRQTGRERARPEVARPFPKIDPKEVIVKALKAARLLKP